jgi:hypothetical protein
LPRARDPRSLPHSSGTAPPYPPRCPLPQTFPPQLRGLVTLAPSSACPLPQPRPPLSQHAHAQVSATTSLSTSKGVNDHAVRSAQSCPLSEGSRRIQPAHAGVKDFQAPI